MNNQTFKLAGELVEGGSVKIEIETKIFVDGNDLDILQNMFDAAMLGYYRGRDKTELFEAFNGEVEKIATRAFNLGLQHGKDNPGCGGNDH